MTLCPIAIVTGCEKCPAFKICPLKGVIGDAKPADDGKNAKPAARMCNRRNGQTDTIPKNTYLP